MTKTIPLSTPSSPSPALSRVPRAASPTAISDRRWRLSPPLISCLAIAAELSLVVLTGLAAAVLWIGIGETFEDNRYPVTVGLTALATIAAGHRLDLFSVPALTSPLRQLPKVAFAWTVAMAVLALSVFLLKAGTDLSRGWLLIWYAAGFVSMAMFRAVAALLVRRWARAGALSRRAVILGAGPEGVALIDALEADGGGEVQICGVFDDRGADRVARSLRGYPLLGNADELVEFCRETAVDLLIVSLPLTAEARLLSILKKIWVLPIDVRIAGTANKLRFHPRAYSFAGSVPLIDVFDKPLAAWETHVKSGFDKIVALAALIALSPVMALVALAVRLDSKGPVLFRQKRLGFNNKPIDVLKFRSMHVAMSDANAAKLVTKGDPRVTRVGRFIRKTSLDELPQLFNVLTGELSLVGPRPHAMQAKAADRLYHDVVDGYFARHRVKPGITGWAQICGWRGETDTAEKIEKRVEHDLYYIENWSLFFDLYILARTPLALLKVDNAY